MRGLGGVRTMAMLALLAAVAQFAAAGKARPHIIMMLADDWGSYDASWRMKELGRKPDIMTPTIDSLSADGVRFSNYYVQPICTPTRSVLLSGRYSIHTGCEHILFGSSEASCLPVDLPIMPQAFKAIGFASSPPDSCCCGRLADPARAALTDCCCPHQTKRIWLASGTWGSTMTRARRGRAASTHSSVT